MRGFVLCFQVQPITESVMVCHGQRLRKRLQRAEGLLELALLFEDRWPLAEVHRKRLADRALVTLDQIKTPRGHRAYWLFLQGQAHRMAERYAEAIDCFQQSLCVDPDNVHARLALAWSYKRVGEIGRAIETLQKAVQADPTSGICHYNLACYWALEANAEASVRHLLLAFEFNPKLKQSVETESDFDLVREVEAFQAVLAILL